MISCLHGYLAEFTKSEGKNQIRLNEISNVDGKPFFFFFGEFICFCFFKNHVSELIHLFMDLVIMKQSHIPSFKKN